MKPIVYCLCLATGLLACQSPAAENTPNGQVPDPFETALPHGTSLPSTELSPEDVQKLATANGRRVDSLRLDSLARMINGLGEGLHILNFWRIDCPECLSLSQRLSDLRQAQEPERFALHLINLDELEALPQVVASIRAQGLSEPCSILVQDSTQQWTDLVQLNWAGSLPALLLLNNTEGIRLFYQKNFSREELQALIAPFTL
ncbi:MAG: hypothetical protein AAFW73_14070 [Bacteroidota bacterium]